jgi:hypothetical protein
MKIRGSNRRYLGRELQPYPAFGHPPQMRNLRCATAAFREGGSWPAEVLRDHLPLRAHVPMGEGEEKGCRRTKMQDTIGELAVSGRRGRETLAEQET